MATEHSKPNRWTRVIVVASLALNLAVVGVVVGVFLSGGSEGRTQRFDLTAGPLTRAMDDAGRAAVRDVLRGSGSFRPRDRRDMRADMDMLVATLRADTFDQAAFRDVLMRQRARLEAGQDAVLDAVSTQIVAMSAQDRAAFADRLETQLRRGGPPPRRQ